MPLRAILFTKDNISEKLKGYIRNNHDKAFGKVNPEHAGPLRKILSIGADHIITTNYSYELEYAAQKELTLSDSKIENLQRHTESVKRAEGKYLLSTYNEVKYGEVTNKIWHIHGEARKHNSIVLGHLYYGNLVTKIKNYVDRNGYRYTQASKNGEKIKIKSWVDAFIMGDVYVLGSRFNLSEIDLWWLIARKKREKARHGKIYFYEPEEISGDTDERLEMLKIYTNDKVETMKVKIPPRDDNNKQICEERDKKFKDFYIKAIEDIANKVIKKREN